MLLSQLCTDFENMTSVQCSLAQDEWLADLGCDLHIYEVNISLLKGLLGHDFWMETLLLSFSNFFFFGDL